MGLISICMCSDVMIDNPMRHCTLADMKYYQHIWFSHMSGALKSPEFGQCFFFFWLMDCILWENLPLYANVPYPTMTTTIYTPYCEPSTQKCISRRKYKEYYIYTQAFRDYTFTCFSLHYCCMFLLYVHIIKPITV